MTLCMAVYLAAWHTTPVWSHCTEVDLTPERANVLVTCHRYPDLCQVISSRDGRRWTAEWSLGGRH